MIRKLQAISELAQSDIGILGNISIQEKKYKANEDILREGEKPTLSFVVLDGLIGGFMRHDDLRAICEQHSSITRVFWRSTVIDAAIYREWVTNVGRRDAYSRMAHIFCELIVRLRSVGRIEDHVAYLPITQAALGDALGLSTVHVNRVLQDLRRDGLISTVGSRFHATDWAGLIRAADFDSTYLHHRAAQTGAGF
ncbi:Crp/Fnr family transcriptional regulator [Mesorhizobium sp. LNJC372A00]|uniref:Crp/Fnr family transcriptional regulator n=1 Tax=Mesorhizobium sp. LNJC372A00 TaxID=1287256 RepID=UPI001FD9F37D|nr:Crp/Fnr family transcriptional regulator [Mesorhizobium sp. LNJC372A00]